MRGDFSKPVSFAELLVDHGLSLSEAHAIATKLAADGTIRLALKPESLGRTLRRLEAMGLAAYAVGEPSLKSEAS